MTEKQSETEIQELILETIRAEKPETTQQLINLVHEKSNLPEKEITRVILELESQNKIRFTKPENPPSTKAAHVFSSKYAWYWITIALAVATTLAVFTIPEDAYPIVYVRQALGVVFVLFLPGYAFIKALFPAKVPIKTSSENLDAIERIALSLGMSIALVPIVGLILNYTPWGIRLTPITLSLLALTAITATVAVARERESAKPQ